MDSTDKILVGVGLGGALGLGLFWWYHRDDEGDLIDQITDAFVTLTTTDESRLSDLEPETQAQVRGLIQDAANAGFGVKVGQTLRTSAQEKALIEAGKTSATLTHSWHQLGRAVDLYVIDPITETACYKGEREDLALQLARMAEARGFRQLGFNADGSKRWITGKKGKVWDVGHIEWRAPYGTIAEAVAAEGSAYGIG